MINQWWYFCSKLMGQLLLEILWVISYHLNEYWNPYNQEINDISRFYTWIINDDISVASWWVLLGAFGPPEGMQYPNSEL